MYRIIVFIFFIVAIIWLLLSMMEKKENLKSALKDYLELLKSSSGKYKESGSLTPHVVLSNLKILLYCMSIISVVILALTGFTPYIFLGKPLSGFTLVLHASVAPVFAICMTALTLLLAYQHLFNKTDWQVVSSAVTGKNNPPSILKHQMAAKIFFWMIILLTPLVMGSIIVSMYPVFGTYGQELLLIIHLVSALFFLIAGIMYTFFLINSVVSETKIEEVKDETLANNELT